MQLENRRELELVAEREVDKDGLREKEEDAFELEADGDYHTDEDGEDEETTNLTEPIDPLLPTPPCCKLSVL